MPYPSGTPSYNVPESIVDDGSKAQWLYSFYLQDEWDILSNVTLNYGLRYDQYAAYSRGNQLSPRINAIWKPFDGTTIHVGYARYFTPPPFELVGNESVQKFSPKPLAPTAGTSVTPGITLDTTPVAERANYFDIGAEQQIVEGLKVGVDGYYKTSRNLIDEGQFGAPIILTPFNYAHGIQDGVELTSDYTVDNFSAYGNVAFGRAKGKDWVTSQFSFLAPQYLYVKGPFHQPRSRPGVHGVVGRILQVGKYCSECRPHSRVGLASGCGNVDRLGGSEWRSRRCLYAS